MWFPGTTPVTTLELLRDNYWNGNAERLFQRDLEAFIWILPFVFRRYQDKKAQKNTSIDRWMTPNHNARREAQWAWTDCPNLEEAGTKVQNDFCKEWPLAVTLLDGAFGTHNRRTRRKRNPNTILSTDFVRVWNEFLAQMRSSARVPGLRYLESLVEALGLEQLLDDDAMPGVASPSGRA